MLHKAHIRCPGKNERIIRAPGAQHATADEWIALMEEEERKKELKKREAEEPDCVKCCEQNVHNKKPCVCALLSIKEPKRGLQWATLCLPDADGVFLCGRHPTLCLHVLDLFVIVFLVASCIHTLNE